jgi:hypothetical protein
MVSQSRQKQNAQELRQAVVSASNLPERHLAFVHLTMDAKCTFGDLMDGLKRGGLLASHAFVILANHFRPECKTDSENFDYWQRVLHERHISLSATVLPPNTKRQTI